MSPRRMSRVALAATIGAVLVVSAACGSSGTGQGTSTSSSSSSSSSQSSQSPTQSESSTGSETSSQSSSGTESGSAGSSWTAPAGMPKAKLTILFGSSGTSETDALKAATADWGKQTGSTVEVTPASNLDQQLAQGFSSNTPPDLFYMDPSKLGTYAKAGDLWSYGDQLPNKSDFYPALVKSFTYNGQLYCAPKDQSTLALWINTADWTAAGLTDADIPTTWDQLDAVAKKLSTGGRVGLALSPTRDRVDAFFVQNGGYLVNDAGTAATVNSEQNIAALTFVKKMLTDGAMKWSSDLNTGWGGEAFGTNKSAMTIEGPWMFGALKSDYPNIKYKIVPLPAGPTGTKGTLVFTNCWAISAASKNHDQALNLVEYLTQPSVEMGFAKAFGVIPSVQSAQAEYLQQFPDNKVFVDGIAYAKGVVSAPGVAQVLADFDSQLGSLATGDPKTILNSVQTNMQSALGGS
ncbi:MAG: extracellular solute-binding protein [Actinobacteria bacterium]|nr:extracellular solute-binding protein [Actinomycetota bacterium]